MSHISGHHKKKFTGDRGRLVFKTGHISVSAAKKWIQKLQEDSKQHVLGLECSYGALEIRTTGDWALVLLSVHKHIDEHNALFRKITTKRFGTCMEPPKPPELENKRLLRKLEIHLEKGI